MKNAVGVFTFLVCSLFLVLYGAIGIPLILEVPEGGARMNLAIIGGGGSGSTTTDYTQDANCMGAWLMTSSGTELDVSLNGDSDLTEVGTVDTNASVPSGYSGTSRLFANGEGLECADGLSTDIYSTNEMSIVMWVRMNDSDTALFSTKYVASGDLRQYQFGWNANPVGYIGINSGAGNCIVTGSVNIADGSWHHFAVVYDAADLRIYIDGSHDTGGNSPVTCVETMSNESPQFTINGYNDQSTGLDGYFDEVAVFDRDLSSAEVLDIYNNGIDGTKGEND